MVSDDEAESSIDEERFALGISLGLLLGVSYGIIFDNFGLAISLGLGVGVSLGLLWGQASEDE
jgi:F0F1-type ATP synthase assembly protein I